jgi:hypothetical protein
MRASVACSNGFDFAGKDGRHRGLFLSPCRVVFPFLWMVVDAVDLLFVDSNLSFSF